MQQQIFAECNNKQKFGESVATPRHAATHRCGTSLAGLVQLLGIDLKEEWERSESYAHVLDGATEGVRDGAIVDGFLAEAKVCQFNVSYTRRRERIQYFLHFITVQKQQLKTT